MIKFNRLLLVATLASLSMQAALSADSEPPPSGDKLAAARQQIAAKQWPRAIEELQRVNDVSSADWNNLMGYSLRKSKTPDLAGSEQYYDAALNIDPKHRGTLAYSGELYLMKGDLARAEQRLTTLGKACASKCPEYLELKKAIGDYKSHGNKWASSY